MKKIAQPDLNTLSQQAKSADRLRKNFNIHSAVSEPVQRLINAFEPGSYVRPHRHVLAEQWELFVIVRGEAVVLLFDDDGTVLVREKLNTDDASRIIEIPANTWHTIFATCPDTVLFECKPGPYMPLADKDFAAWAPAENTAQAAGFISWFTQAQPGDSAPLKAFIHE